MQLGIIVGLFFGVIIALFAFVNKEMVIINYFFGQVQASVALIVLGSAMAGALAIGLLGLITQIRTGFAIWDYKKKTKQLTKTVESLQVQKQTLTTDLDLLKAEYEQIKETREQPEEPREEVLSMAIEETIDDSE